MLHVHFVVHVSLSISEFVKLTNHSEAQKFKTFATDQSYYHRVYRGSTSHSLASVLRRGLLSPPPPPPPLWPFPISMMTVFSRELRMPLFSSLAKQGVRIIIEKLNLSTLCDITDVPTVGYSWRLQDI